jgi:hypothetical protein
MQPHELEIFIRIAVALKKLVEMHPQTPENHDVPSS